MSRQAVPAGAVPLQRGQCARRSVRRGDALYSAGDVFRALYVMRFGVLKSFLVTDDGLVQVMGFHLPGDALGLDGLGSDRHCSNVVALDDAEVFVLPYAQCRQPPQAMEPVYQAVMGTLAHAFVRSQAHLLALGTRRAEQRLVLFLLDLSVRYGHLGYSSSQFVLRMTRQDIGSYLGLELETISRLLSRLHAKGLIHVQGKAVALLDLPGLWELTGGSSACCAPAVPALVDREGDLRAFA